MSVTYPDLINNFPDAIDPNRTYQDASSSTKSLVDQYYAYKNSGDDTNANALVIANPILKDILFTAYDAQYLYDMNVSQQRFYMNDIQQYLINIVKPKGTWNSDTVYTKYDVVQYTVDGAIQSYMGIVVSIPKGTLPTNTSYFVCITLKGDQGVSGTGLAPRGSWVSTTQYYTNDCISYNNYLWYAKQNSLGQTPTVGTYWDQLMGLKQQIIFSSTQPDSQDTNDLWYQIL